MLWRQAKAGPDDADILARQRLSRLDRLDCVDRTAKPHVGLLAPDGAIIDRSERRPCRLAVVDQPLELVRFERKRCVRTTVCARERKVLLDYGAAQHDRSDAGGRARRMIGKAGHCVESLAEMRHRAHIRFLDRSRVGTRAVQERDAAGAVATRRFDRLLNLAETGHTGRDDHRFALFGDIFDERQVNHLERCDLVGGSIEPCEQGDSGLVEGTGEDRDPQLARLREHLPMPFIGCVSLLVELVEPVAVPQATLDQKFLAIVRNGHGVGRIGLDLDRVSAASGGGFNQLQRFQKLAVMVRRQFGDDVRRMVRADLAPRDDEFRALHHNLRSWCAREGTVRSNAATRRK